MKNFLLSIFLLLTIPSFSQVEVSTAIGASNQAGLFNLQIGYNVGNSHIFYNQLVHLTNAAIVPDVIGARYGLHLGGFEPFIGADYFLISAAAKEKNWEGWHLGYGLSYELNRIKLSVGGTGNVYYLTVGVNRILE